MRASILAAPLAVATLSAGLLAGCSNSASTAPSRTPASAPSTPSGSTSTSPSSLPPATQPTKPLETESNPPGDIPDNQVFVAYQPPGAGLEVKVPEGWARTASKTTTSFSDKLNRIQVAVSTASAAPTVRSATDTLVPVLKSQVPQFATGQVKEVSRSAGKTVLITYRGDSAPDPVTGKVVRDSFEQYLYFHNGRLLTLTLSGPTNADNVDPWRIVSDSVRWL